MHDYIFKYLYFIRRTKRRQCKTPVSPCAAPKYFLLWHLYMRDVLLGLSFTHVRMPLLKIDVTTYFIYTLYHKFMLVFIVLKDKNHYLPY